MLARKVNMNARASWAATAVGTAVGTGGWILGLGNWLSPAHPMWALLFLTLGATILTSIVVQRIVRN
jgi:hypothetical protein